MPEQIPENILKSFREFVNRFIPADDKLFDAIISNLAYSIVARKEFYSEAGNTATKIFFFSEGFVQFYQTKNDATDV